MRNTARTVSLSALIVCLSGPIAVAGSGGQAAAFLRLPFGASIAGMGSACTAVQSDVASSYYNPALLVGSEPWILGTGYAFMSLDRGDVYGSLSKTFPSVGGFGLQWRRFGVRNIEGSDASGNPTGTFDDAETMISAGFAQKIIPLLTGGVSLKYLHQSLAQYSADGYGADLGVISNLPVKTPADGSITVGASVLNIAGRLKWNSPAGSADRIPTTLRIGGSWNGSMADFTGLAALDMEKTSSETALLHAGLEVGYRQLLWLRGGYDGHGLTGGFSVRVSHVRAHFALRNDVIGERVTTEIGLQFAW